jgi:hypothetical protein
MLRIRGSLIGWRLGSRAGDGVQAESAEHGPKVEAARGPQAVEALLLAEVERLVEASRARPEELARPVRVVVPSRSLADHVAAALVRRTGRPVAGVSVRTLHALAEELVARGGGSPRGGDAFLPVRVRQVARAEPELARGLDDLDDGYRTLEESVRDLLDAGFETVHADALFEAIDAAAPAGAPARRARAVVRVAAAVAGDLEAGRIGHRSWLLRGARELLVSRPELLPARALLLHGFADATGVQLDLIEALLRLPGARLLLDRPADPADPGRDDPGVVFTRRATERLAPGGLGALPPAAPAAVAVLHAPTREAEVRAAAEGVRERLAAGIAPERIGVVARDLSGYRLALRRHFRRLGIPFSGHRQPGPLQPAGRRLAALRELLRHGARLPAERWLEIALPGPSVSPRARADLRLALHVLGTPRVGEVAGLALDADAVELPFRVGLYAPEGGGAPRATRRRVSRDAIQPFADAAREVCACLSRWPGRAPLRAHFEALRGLVESLLRWDSGSPEYAAVAAAWGAGDAGTDLELDREDFLLHLDRELSDAGCDALGGAGAGVQVLTVMEARERSFDSLFVLGLNRDVFPRAIAEDALLPDALRRRLREVLPDLPVKAEGTHEERFLFAQLLGASPEIRLSCALADDEGKRRLPSPLLERLRLSGPGAEPRALPALHGRRRAETATACTAPEQALLAGIHGTRERFEALLPLALEEGWRESGESPAAAPRLAVLREMDAPARPGGDLGPYFGFVGEIAAAQDLRRNPLFVTTAERVAGCPWRALLERLLRVELVPDALVHLPQAKDALRIGALVHRVLEQIASQAGVAVGEPLEQAVARAAVEVAWPEPPVLDRLLDGAARALAREEGLGFAGHARVLAHAARAVLASAHAAEWAGGPPRVLGVEVLGGVDVVDADGETHQLRFKADRVDRSGGALRLLDYKTGAAKADLATEAKRREKLLDLIGRGELLQAAAYALGARAAGGAGARGDYVFVKPGIDPQAVRLSAEAEDPEVEARFGSALRAVFAVWKRGSFFPRLLDASQEEPHACTLCEVREACWRGDSGARRRLADWVTEAAAPTPAEQALRLAWELWP